jgi:hypothetical protein
MTPDRDVERTSVKTYVPSYQKKEWKTHADELGMSQSEFVRTMVQAGRRGFEPPELETDAEGEAAESADPDEPASETARSPGANPRGSTSETGSQNGSNTPQGDDVRHRVVAVLEREGVLSWEDLLEEVTDDIEKRLDDAIQDLQTENRVLYSGREGGYTLADQS